MNTRLIEYVVTISEEGSLSKAAEKLYITQSALSQAILKLEAELGTALFIRNRRTLVPTKAGQIYIRAGKEILDIKTRAYQNIFNGIENIFKCGVSSSDSMVWALDAARKVHEAHPNTIIYTYEGKRKELLNELKQGNYFAVITTIPFLNQFDNDPTLDYCILKKEEIWLLSKKGELNSLLGPDGKIDVCMLRDKHFVLSTQHSTMRSITDNIFDCVGFKPAAIAEIDNFFVLTKMVNENNCIGFITAGLRNRIQDPSRFDFFPLAEEKYRYQVIVFPKKTAGNNKIIDEFIHELIKCSENYAHGEGNI